MHFGWFNTLEFNKGWYERNWEDFEKYEYILPLKYLGSPTKRDKTKDQIEIVIDNLRIRKSPNGEILGFINPGIYNTLESYKDDNYIWYKIEEDMWVAYSESFGNFLEKENENNSLNNEEILEEITIKDNVKIKKKGIFSRIFQIILDFIKKIFKLF